MRRNAIWAWVAMGVLATWVSVNAQEEAAPETGLESTLAVGLTMTDGNSETTQINGSLVSEGEKQGLGSVRIGIEGNYAESTVGSNTETTVENAKVFGNVKKTLSEKTFAYLDATVLYDDIALIDYRGTLGPGVGLYFIKNDKTKFLLEGGPSYVWEKVDGITDDYVAVRVAERIEHKLSETAHIWQSLEYLAQADDFGNYLLNTEVGTEAALNSHMNLRVVVQDKYDNEPGEGLKHNDITIIAGISVKF